MIGSNAKSPSFTPATALARSAARPLLYGEHGRQGRICGRRTARAPASRKANPRVPRSDARSPMRLANRPRLFLKANLLPFHAIPIATHRRYDARYAPSSPPGRERAEKAPANCMPWRRGPKPAFSPLDGVTIRTGRTSSNAVPLACAWENDAGQARAVQPLRAACCCASLHNGDTATPRGSARWGERRARATQGAQASLPPFPCARSFPCAGLGTGGRMGLIPLYYLACG